MSDSAAGTALAIWRAVRTPLTLLVLLGILGTAAWWGYDKVTEPIPPRPPDPCVTQPVADNKLEVGQVTIRIFNGGKQRGLAGDVAQDAREVGFNVSRVDNTDEEIVGTVIVVQGKDFPETKLVAAFFPEAVIREDPTKIDHSIDVLVGEEFPGFNAKAPTTIEHKAATICLPKRPSPGLDG
ncbi:LytR C-terminal domain-containing protein [Propionibacteriaceae bacterium Y2011]|uniref:LytR C-terminal domain-containing protein n=1 Tax=Microlunatus sp. Y2014 TaxID=3418488 RepID=UPI003B4F255E